MGHESTIQDRSALSSAYLLVSHGSRDPRPQVAAEHLAELVARRLELLSGQTTQKTTFHPLVGTATLEFSLSPLHKRIEQFALLAKAEGWSEVQIVPLFLHRGVHVLEDIPAEVAIARAVLGDRIALKLSPYLGSYRGITSLLSEQFDRANAVGRILLSHGTRRAEGNEPIAAIASQLKALPAYWSVAPSLSERVEVLVTEGCSAIAIVPYFLFTGGISEAIARQVEQLQVQFSHTSLLLSQPLGPTPELARVIVEGIIE
jgi:sirohydrochlorin cobaltochelatase